MKVYRSFNLRLALSVFLLLKAVVSMASSPEEIARELHACFLREVEGAAERYKEKHNERQIPTKKGSLVAQPGATLNELYVNAGRTKSQFDASLKIIAQEHGAQAITAHLKRIERTSIKVEKKLHGNISAVTDILRGTILCNSLEEVHQVKDAIAETYPDHRFKDRFEKPKSNGYRDLQATVLVVSPDPSVSPHWAEIQVQLRSLYNAKAKNGDVIYRHWRALEEASTHRALAPEEKLEIVSLKIEEKNLYDDAWVNAQH